VILFCDTSALLKLFIDEQGSESMIKARVSSEGIAVCRITWAESMAALAQRARFKGASQSGLAKARSTFEQAWPDFVIAEVGFPQNHGQVNRRHAMTLRLSTDDQSNQDKAPVHGAAEAGSD
jgi:predicted nucleic acid-binding protein